MKIAILGAGHGGKAAAADMTLSGHTVNLFEVPEFGENLTAIRERGGIQVTGVGRTGFARLNAVTSDIAEALEGVELVMPVVPAFGHKPLAKLCAPHLEEGQTVVLNPGSTLGSLEFLEVLRETGVKTRIKIGDIHTLTYAARGEGAEVRILLEVGKLWLAAFPATDTPEVLAKVRQLYPVVEAGRNVLDVGLNNGNPMAHPGPALLNAGRVEYSGGEFYHYKEGITPHVANVVQAIDEERMALCRKLGYPAMPTPERMFLMGYAVTKSSYYEAYTTSPVFCGENPIKGPHSVMDRYYVEDTTYGCVTWSSLGRSIGVPTPTIDAVIQLISVLHGKDYFAQGERSLERFALAGLSVKELNAYLETGRMPVRRGKKGEG